jgi:hypothetical protein
MPQLAPLLRLSALVIALIASPHAAQYSADDADAPVSLDAENVADLRPVTWIPFTDLPPETAVLTGWFALSPDGAYFAGINAGEAGGLLIWDAAGVLIDAPTLPLVAGYAPTILDVAFDPGTDRPARLAFIATADGQTYTAAVHEVGGETRAFDLPPEAGRPARAWLEAGGTALWIESAAPDPDDLYIVARLDLDNPDTPLMIAPSGPEHDRESAVRIGRIPAPLAITAAEDGRARLWDLQTGAITAEVQLDEMPVFGRINEATAGQLVWRDQESQALHLLDFATGEDRLVADIGQEYIQALLLTPGGDVILAVHIGDDPVVAAWDAATGERRDLGRYRADCGRVPDMAQLSRDGTTLAVGCDAGIEIWRVTP